MINNVDENAKEPQTETMPYGGDKTSSNSNVNSPSIHDLATQQVEEAFGPDAHNNPTFDSRVKDAEAQMFNNIEVTKAL